jgi:hypothetical protein
MVSVPENLIRLPAGGGGDKLAESPPSLAFSTFVRAAYAPADQGLMECAGLPA